MDEIGLYIRTIQQDYNPKTKQELSDLITEFFNVICLPEDIEYYESLYIEHLERTNQLDEDFELEARRHDYFSKLNRSNPFY